MSRARVTSPLTDGARRTAGEALQDTLVELICLSLSAKHAHWNVTGRHFRSLHEQLDEVVAVARRHSDGVAERAVAIGINPDGRVGTVREATGLPQIEAGFLPDDKVISTVTDLLGQLIQRCRERIAATQEADLVTQDLLIEVTGDLEELHWMFEVQH